jgi:enoyl-CoA hydratase
VSLVEVTRPSPGLAVLTLNRPKQLNALTGALVSALHESLDALSSDQTCRVVVLTGAGRGFCAGLDLHGYGDAPGVDGVGRPQAGLAVQKHIASLVSHLRSIPQPVIAAVNGPAMGGGLGLVLACDIRLAETSAVFSAAFIRVGLSACDIGTSWLLPRLIGAARAHELMLTGRNFDANEAERIGLVSQVVAAGDLMATTQMVAAQIMQHAPMGVALTKEGMWTALEIPGLHAGIEYENRQQQLLVATTDHREALRAFAEKRPPEFRNR